MFCPTNLQDKKAKAALNKEIYFLSYFVSTQKYCFSKYSTASKSEVNLATLMFLENTQSLQTLSHHVSKISQCQVFSHKHFN